MNLGFVMFNHFPPVQVLSSSFEHPDELLMTDKCSSVSKDANFQLSWPVLFAVVPLTETHLSARCANVYPL